MAPGIECAEHMEEVVLFGREDRAGLRGVGGAGLCYVIWRIRTHRILRRLQPEQEICADVEEHGDGADLDIARRARALLDAVEHALVQMNRPRELALLHIAFDAQIINAAANVARFSHHVVHLPSSRNFL